MALEVHLFPELMLILVLSPSQPVSLVRLLKGQVYQSKLVVIGTL